MNKVCTTLVETLSTSSVILSIIISINIIPTIDCLAQYCASSKILDSYHTYVLHLSTVIMVKCWHQNHIPSKAESAQWQHCLCEITTVLSWQVYDYGFGRTSTLQLISCHQRHTGTPSPSYSIKLKSNRTQTSWLRVCSLPFATPGWKRASFWPWGFLGWFFFLFGSMGFFVSLGFLFGFACVCLSLCLFVGFLFFFF